MANPAVCVLASRAARNPPLQKIVGLDTSLSWLSNVSLCILYMTSRPQVCLIRFAVCPLNRSKVQTISRIRTPRTPLFTQPAPGGSPEKHMEYQAPKPPHESVYAPLQNLAELL